MKKIALFSLAFCVALCAIIFSCSKSVKPPMVYSVTRPNDSNFVNTYIPDSGTYDFPVWVKFLSGNPYDSVTLSFSGLPADVRVTPATFSGIPTYTEHFTFYTNHAIHGSYQVTLNAYSPTTGTHSYTFTLGVVPANCSLPFVGSLSCANACGTGGNYHYTATGSSYIYNDQILVNNFGGYGTNVNVIMVFDCGTDSVFIPNRNYGNNVVLQGKGTFTDNKIIMYYTASSTPSGFPDSCTDTLSVQ